MQVRSENSEVERITVEEGVVSIEDFEFAFCEKLRRINLPESLVEIGVSAFVFCGALEKIKIPYDCFCFSGSLKRLA